ncbi:hypothetical protein [Microbacterium paludicola]|uniref:hypothetical protein n=1 Tax=Microbacterium paludicola TaxID=300019 RepID=UPI0011A5DF27|nr:hypothetical protein [Microbacterium paludicola]
MSMSAQLAELIERYIPEDWRLIPYTDVPDVLDRPVVMIDTKTIGMGPSLGILQAGVHVYVLQPAHSSTEDNERALDDAMPLVVDVLSRVESVTSVNASRVTFAEKFPAWDIDLTLYVPITYDEPEEA